MHGAAVNLYGEETPKIYCFREGHQGKAEAPVRSAKKGNMLYVESNIHVVRALHRARDEFCFTSAREAHLSSTTFS